MSKIVILSDEHAQTPELDQIVSVREEPLVMSYFDRSQQAVNGFSAAFLRENSRRKEGTAIPIRAGYRNHAALSGDWKGRFSRRDAGHEIFYHGMLISEKLGKTVFAYDTEKELDGIVYSYLMENFDLRILPEWAPALTEELRKGSAGIRTGEFGYAFGEHSAGEKLFGGKRYVAFPEWLREERIENAVSTLLKGGRIRIPGAARGQLPMEIKDLDTYLKNQGSTLAENLQGLLKSRVDLDGEVTNLAFKDFSLYRQQALMVNGAVKMLGKKKSGKARYCFLSMDMGTGKTATAVSIVEKFECDKFLRLHKDKTFKDLLSEEDLLRYRVMVLAPGHLLEKWKREIEERVVFSKVEIIRDFEQLTELRERKEPAGREYYIISKDFAKLDYQEQPVPARIRYNAPVKPKICSTCGGEFLTPGRICPHCGNNGYVLGEKGLYTATGLMCPECGQVLLPYAALSCDRIETESSLMPEDFARETTHNQKCWYCDTPLWQPFVRNLELPWWAQYKTDEEAGAREALKGKMPGMPKKASWKRITVVKNRGTGKTETLWAHTKYQERLIDSALSVKGDNGGCRKTAPGGYIKKYLHFDFLIADEAHEYKGATAQGEVFSALCSVSDRVLALTGTITGGKASDLFYLLWRLDPARMVKDGFAYTDVIGFSYRYGKVVRELREEEGAIEMGTSSRNVRYSSPRVEPGISPLVYPKFLHDRQVALSLSDMSANLPELKEKVISVKPDQEEEQIFSAYEEIISLLKAKAREKGMYGLLSTMLQFSLSYPDRPYTEERKAIYDPYGEEVCRIPQFDFMRDPKRLSSKEKALLEDVRDQLQRGRNCVIYCEYTASPDTSVTDRLKTILERETGVRVEILRAQSPAPCDREAYMRRLTEEGTRVWITNPRCTETGLDFIWAKDGVTYNFPTIINFQLGYSLPVVMQSTRRHYRLIQTEECETHYICWEGTIETAVLKVIAEKQMAHSSVQGKFSAEGLAAMMDGADSRKEIFNALMKNDRTSGANLQSMFDVIASQRHPEKASSEKKMPTVRDILGDERYEELFCRKESGFRYESGEDGEAEFNVFDIF